MAMFFCSEMSTVKSMSQNSIHIFGGIDHVNKKDIVNLLQKL